MDTMRRIRRTYIPRYSLIALVLFVLVALFVIPETRFRLDCFGLGVRHGWEDQQNRLTYATEAPIWKMMRNSQNWRERDVDLVQRLVASSADEINTVVPIFMVGYRLGFFASEFWIVIAILGLVFAGMIFRRLSTRRYYQKSGTVTFSRTVDQQ